MGAGTSLFDASQVCLDISSNTLDGNAAKGGSGILIRQQEISTLRLRGYTGTPFDTAAVAAFATSQNPGSTPAPTATTIGAGGGFLNTSPAGSQCLQAVCSAVGTLSQERWPIQPPQLHRRVLPAWKESFVIGANRRLQPTAVKKTYHVVTRAADESAAVIEQF